MELKKKMAPIGKNPIDATTAYGIQSKAVFKYTDILGLTDKTGYLNSTFTGVEACQV
ncbi:hypothetical protein [Mongoliitalea daihaiensis]|uniref:hypothetical protein n=1 Tax=Mongoliitalea daihaiensis TaxID=2782006 RepID=UPI001F2A8875|nr:hypothetical protein [Mongoliitalea daihaiensis]UJP65541.1 hypothetical protein IPZ59_02625 [Mongoliitalea daihaiensis]